MKLFTLLGFENEFSDQKDHVWQISLFVLHFWHKLKACTIYLTVTLTLAQCRGARFLVARNTFKTFNSGWIVYLAFTLTSAININNIIILHKTRKRDVEDLWRPCVLGDQDGFIYLLVKDPSYGRCNVKKRHVYIYNNN